MSIWNSYINLLKKLQFFTWAGSIIWSILPLPLLGVFVYQVLVTPEPIPLSIIIISCSGTGGNLVFLSMIPQCIRNFKRYINSEIKNEILTNNMQAPSKLIWVVFLDCLLLSIVYFILAPTANLTVFTLAMMYLVSLVYLTVLGVLFGSLTKTFSMECKAVDDSVRLNSFEKATCLLLKFKELKRASQLCLLIVAVACTFITIIAAYYLMVLMAYTCLGGIRTITFFLPAAIQIKLYVLYLCFFSYGAHECYESFKGVSEQLR